MKIKRLSDIINESKSEVNNRFTEVEDFGDKKLFTRSFGKVGLTDKKGEDYDVQLIVVAEIYDLRKSGAIPEEDLDKRGDVQLSMALLPEEKFISKKIKAAVKADSGKTKDILLDVFDYAGGLNYSPNEKYFFKTIEAAEKYLMTPSLSSKIDADGMMSGFIMDKHYNRAGNTNWDRLNDLMFKD